MKGERSKKLVRPGGVKEMWKGTKENTGLSHRTRGGRKSNLKECLMGSQRLKKQRKGNHLSRISRELSED